MFIINKSRERRNECRLPIFSTSEYFQMPISMTRSEIDAHLSIWGEKHLVDGRDLVGNLFTPGHRKRIERVTLPTRGAMNGTQDKSCIETSESSLVFFQPGRCACIWESKNDNPWVRATVITSLINYALIGVARSRTPSHLLYSANNRLSPRHCVFSRSINLSQLFTPAQKMAARARFDLAVSVAICYCKNCVGIFGFNRMRADWNALWIFSESGNEWYRVYIFPLLFCVFLLHPDMSVERG